MTKKRKPKNLWKDRGGGYWKPDKLARSEMRNGEKKIKAHYEKEKS
jgi:hypothetical protein